MAIPVDFLVIGAQRCGTTTLWNVLRSHPELFLPDAKEVQYLSTEAGRQRGPRFLEPHFRSARPGQMRGFADVQLMAHPDAARWVHDHFPRAKLIAILRDPAERAHSAYWFMRGAGLEPAPTLAEAMRRERAGEVRGEWEQAHLTHLEHGRYATQLTRYLERFPRSQLRILWLDDLWENPRAVFQQLFRWLGVDESPAGVPYTVRSNRAARRRSHRLQRLLGGDTALRWHYRSWVDDRTRVWIRNALLTRLDRLNRVVADPPPLDPVTRMLLIEEYRDEIEALETLTGRDRSSWLR